MKCKYYRKYGQCAKNNDENDFGDCIYKDGIITEKLNIHCSEGRAKLRLKAINLEGTIYENIKTE